MKSPGVIRTESSPDAYDAHHSLGQLLCCEKTIYYLLYRAVCRHIEPRRKILEVGCGTGALAHCLLAELGISYRGFDFRP
jgi:16S rRNA A1518/A1519 N6-dimethyltransferase RsmA/KsgA/DIM1 with predicted DNA glycosylase/AP lyase activity